jgi:hypothetical protein
MTKQIIAFIIIAFIFLSSCVKEMQVPHSNLKKIFGKWQWVSSTGGLAGKTITPASEGYSLRVEFRTNGIYRKYKSDTLAEQKKFSFSPETSIHHHKPVWTVSFDEGSPKMAISFSGPDTLILDEQVFDGFEHVYSRIK